jgi:hypothetical protein
MSNFYKNKEFWLKPRTSKRREMIKMRGKINEKETNKNLVP